MAKAQQPQRGTKSPGLDMMRLFAAVSVLVVHGGKIAGITAFTDHIAFGAILFMILSGYLGCISLSHETSVAHYYKHRIARIVPLYWLVLALRYLFDIVLYASRMPLREVFAGPCGPRYLRYFFFLQMFIPSDNWDLWNNRNTLWTMSAFAFFYLIAPLLNKVLNSFTKSFVALLICIAGKGFLSGIIESGMQQAGYPAEAHASQFSAWNPLVVLYCFLLGWVAYYAVKEGRALLFGAFCLLVPVLTNYERCTQECILTALLLLVLILPMHCTPHAEKIISTVSGSSFFLYLVHPMLLEYLPLYHGANTLVGAAYLALMIVGAIGICLVLYQTLVHRYEKQAAAWVLSLGKGGQKS